MTKDPLGEANRTHPKAAKPHQYLIPPPLCPPPPPRTHIKGMGLNYQWGEMTAIELARDIEACCMRPLLGLQVTKLCCQGRHTLCPRVWTAKVTSLARPSLGVPPAGGRPQPSPARWMTKWSVNSNPSHLTGPSGPPTLLLPPHYCQSHELAIGQYMSLDMGGMTANQRIGSIFFGRTEKMCESR